MRSLDRLVQRALQADASQPQYDALNEIVRLLERLGGVSSFTDSNALKNAAADDFDDDDTVVLSMSPADRVSFLSVDLFAQSLLVDLAVEQLLVAEQCKPAIGLLYLLTSDDSVARELYSHPGVANALVQCLEILQFDPDMHRFQRVKSTLRVMIMWYENMANFVHAGYAKRVVDLIESTPHDHPWSKVLCAIGLLSDCADVPKKKGADGEVYDYEGLWADYFHVPGLVNCIVQRDLLVEAASTFRTLIGGCRRIAGEMLAFPGLVDLVVRCAEQESHRWRRNRTAIDGMYILACLAEYEPVQVLVECPKVLYSLSSTARLRDRVDHKACKALVDWQVALSISRGGQSSSHQKAVGFAEEDEAGRRIVIIWHHAPRLWAVIGTPRVKQRSPLRRLPIEMFLLLKDTLCGSGGSEDRVRESDEDDDQFVMSS